MIKKEKAKKLGIKIREQNHLMGKKNKELIEKLKSLLPNIINSDGTLNTEALQDAIDTSHRTSKKNQGYELTFVGKSEAGWIAGSPTKKELKTEKEQSKNFEKTQNVLIRGDNLDVLKILYQNYHNKIKMIYIDPPYNTQSDEFTYKDNFKKSEQELIEKFKLEEEQIDFLHNIYGTKTHSGWLAFMYPRLKLARDLLKEDGVIFISIDDNEQANLKIMCDEIFGEDNFVAQFVWKTRQASGKQIAENNTSIEHEYILCYSRVNLVKFLGVSRDRNSYKNPDNDPRGDWAKHPLDVGSTKDERPNCFYEIIDPITNIKYPANPNRVWAFSPQRMDKLIKEGKILFDPKNKTKPYLKKFWSELKTTHKPFSSWLAREEFKVPYNTEGTQSLNKLFDNRKIFDYPKPSSFIKLLIQQISANPNDIILDFFAGSGTTGDAVMQLNAEDGGNRKFILVQWDEEINSKKNKEAHDFCTKNKLSPVISSLCLERLNRAGEKIKREHQTKRGMFPSSEGLDIGYKVFSLKKKPAIGKEDEIFKLKNERQSTLDTLFNMLSTTGKTLDTPIQEIQKDVLYECDGEIYLIAKTNPERLENYRNHKVNIDGYAEIDLESFLNMEVATRENINIIY